MKKLLLAVFPTILLLVAPASAHRLDEYLEATILSIQSDRVEGSLRLVPGVAVSSAVIASIDANGNGTLPEPEQQRYALRVLADLSLSIDRQPLKPRLVSADFPSVEEMREGIGEIHISFIADLPRGGADRRLTYENHHQSQLAAYLVNCLVPSDKNIRITGQNRNENQSFYQLDFVDADRSGGEPPAQAPLFSSLSGFAGAFRLGMRHISEGTDHIMFLLALLLPAPLLARGCRWGRSATTFDSLRHILGIVTAFSVGHSLTLALAASGIVHVPSRPIEVLIAVSILLSALHAIRPMFPGREAAIAASFGLIHGLAFATAVSGLGFGGWYRLISLLGFNLGIEAMQIMVVTVTMPSFLLLSRTPAYSLLRVGGALFAALAATGWIVERLLNVRSALDSLVERAAHHGPEIAGTLFLLSSVSWWLRTSPASRSRCHRRVDEAHDQDQLPDALPVISGD
jgi:hypothetical protein